MTLLYSFPPKQAGRNSLLISTYARAVLESLATHESARRRGYGALLVSEGTKLADDMDYPMYLDASKVGKFLYIRAGFQEVDVVQSSPSVPLVRPRKSERGHDI